ncbi:uncharacterized protein LOC125241364 [Leguminivora glycinivorella]|uniref:uncharacterized protein LOC125241364 n=1 Tax=Leguminivora glycinivorella TaxID=1035111 RepID=UPI00201097AF|nr:uncharacterized protein LOC125241364 [Leguminivora glycinivorella]
MRTDYQQRLTYHPLVRGLLLVPTRQEISSPTTSDTNRMKLLGVMLLCAVVAAVPTAVKKIDPGFDISDNGIAAPEGFSTTVDFLINQLIRQLFNFIRLIINNGSAVFGVPPLDPLFLEDFHLYLPLGLVNLDLDLKNALVTGIGGFVVHTSRFTPSALTFAVDISVPSIVVEAEAYDLVGDLLTAIPLYGKGKARFQIDGFRFSGTLLLKQSDDGKSVLLDRVINSSYQIPHFQSELTGVIGGGNIDKVVNAMLEDVIIDYANRFQGAIAAAVSVALPAIANPVLEQLDTWKYIDRFV